MSLRQYWLTPLIIAAIALSNSANAGTSSFETEMMSKSAIPQPANPFVLIFFQTADNTTYYDLQTDGVVSQSDWANILQHVGYIAPYSYFNPIYLTTWSNKGSDVAVRAAQSIGRQSGGSVMGADLSNTSLLNSAYSDPLALGMTHFFDDFEPATLPDLGAPGGTGSFRLRVDHQQTGSLVSATSSDFYTVNSTDPLSSFTVSFDLNQQNFVYGGSAHLFGCRSGGYDGASLGWDVRIINIAGGYQNSFIYFYSDGYASVKGPQIDLSQNSLWHHITISVVPDPQYPGYVDVTITADRPDGSTSSTSGRVIRPTINNTYPAGFYIAGDADTSQPRVVDYDNILLTSTSINAVIAKYSFESDADPSVVVQANQSIGIALDDSGRNHNLQPATGTAANKYTYFPTDGVDPTLSAQVSGALTTPLLTARSNVGVAPPILLTNYSLSDKPGRFGAWKGIGFTHGSTNYYLYSDVQPGFANLTDVLKTQNTQWAWNDGSNWHHVWWGNVNNSSTPINSVPTATQQQTALTLAILDGNRWFSVFTSMSNGTLASYADFGDPGQMATVNADVLYALAQTASWFQGTSNALQDSAYVPSIAGVPPDLAPYCRARLNPTTNEFWFAGISPQANRAVTINVPTQTGIATNLATGAQTTVVDGTLPLTLTADAQPYYFLPAPIVDLAVSLSGTPDSVLVGQTVTYTITVANNGPSAATNVTASGTLPSCDLGTLASGTNASCTRSVPAASVGTLSQTMSAAATEVDLNPANNSATATTTVNAPDLIPTAVSASKNKGAVSVSDTVQNQGNASAGAFTVSYYLSTNTTYEPGSDLVLVTTSGGSTPCTRTVGSLSPGTSSSASSLTCYKPANVVTGQRYYVLVVDDATNQVIESNETNNVMAATSQVWW